MDTLLDIVITESEVFFYEEIRKEVNGSDRRDRNDRYFSGVWICRDKDTGSRISGDVGIMYRSDLLWHGYTACYLK